MQQTYSRSTQKIIKDCHNNSRAVKGRQEEKKLL
jgi:hypothetical protein